MTDVEKQLRLIRKAHTQRVKDNVEGGIRTLTFAMEPFTDLGLELLATERPDLEGLSLIQTKITNQGLRWINSFSRLQWLNLSRCKISHESILLLDPALPLQDLVLPGMLLSYSSSAHLSKFRSLKNLSFFWDKGISAEDPAFVDDSISLLCSGVAKFVELSLTGYLLNGTCVPALVKQCELRGLSLGWTNIPALALHGLAQLTSLKWLVLSSTQLDDEALESLTALENLESLAVSNCPISDRAVDHILKLRKLKYIGFEDVKVSRECATRLFALPELQGIEIVIEGTDSDYWYSLVQDRPHFHLEA